MGITLVGYFLLTIQKIYNLFITRQASPHSEYAQREEWKAIVERAKQYTDFSDHLTTLFEVGMRTQPKLIVELGTRGGDSTFVLERVAQLCNADFVSVDIEDCSTVATYPRWFFMKQDDVLFAQTFTTWCQEKGLPTKIDLLFIDTSHLYEHTVQEINSWFPHLTEQGKAVFHDTNLKRIYFRKDGSMGVAWNNKRGVIRALEEYLGTTFQEQQDFQTQQAGWSITHQTHSAGFTVLEKQSD
jgi:cephalosporin hydroxylase